MKIAIIGAGFFGHHIADEISRRRKSADIEIFEMERQPLLGAGTINQCRLHLGFHYPRSGYTIYQSVMGFDRFVEKYPEFVNPVVNNLYAVHSEGLTTAEQYLAVMDSFSLKYEQVPLPDRMFAQPEKISLLLRVPEMSIDVRAVRQVLSAKFPGHLHLGVCIRDIDAGSGMLHTEAGSFGPFDYIINATYTDLNLGLPAEKRFPVKYELTALLLCETTLGAAEAVTIMDGEFISVYPAYGGLHTFSSVRHTPFRRYGEIADLQRDYPNRHELARADGVSEKIVRHVESHMTVRHTPRELWVTAKTKLATDKGDSRVTEVRRESRLLSVLCGKLDAVFEASDAILKEI